MKRSHQKFASAGLPVTRNLAPIYGFSLAIALFMVVVSVAGLLYPTHLYPTEDLLQHSMPNDAVNLIIGLPLLLGSMALAQRDKLPGLLAWPGALFYVFYNYAAYAFGMPLSAVFPLYLILVSMSVYTLIALVASIDAHAVQQRLTGVVPEKLGGGALATYGALFLLLALGTMGQAITGQSTLSEAELAVRVADALMAPAWLIGGVMLWRRDALGYVAGAAMLFHASALFVSVILVLLLQPLMTAASFAGGDIIALFVMGLVCFIPLGLFLRGMLSKRE